MGGRWSGSKELREVWCRQKPPQRQCSICQRRLKAGEENSECRRTGFRGTEQTWPYCPDCWDFKLKMDALDYDAAAIIGIIRKDPYAPGRGQSIKYHVRTAYKAPAY